jgi:hypothetical protein
VNFAVKVQVVHYTDVVVTTASFQVTLEKSHHHLLSGLAVIGGSINSNPTESFWPAWRMDFPAGVHLTQARGFLQCLSSE